MDTQCNLCKKLDIVSECTGILGYIYKAVEYGHQLKNNYLTAYWHCNLEQFRACLSIVMSLSPYCWDYTPT